MGYLMNTCHLHLLLLGTNMQAFHLRRIQFNRRINRSPESIVCCWCFNDNVLDSVTYIHGVTALLQNEKFDVIRGELYAWCALKREGTASDAELLSAADKKGRDRLKVLVRPVLHIQT